jgi:hypothetical protein
MNYPIQPSWPLAIIVITGGLALLLAISFIAGIVSRKQKLADKYGNTRYRRLPRIFRWHHLSGSLIMLLIAILLFWIVSAAQAYLELTGKILVAHVRATPVHNPSSNVPMLSVNLTSYDHNGNPTAETTYVLNGDEVYIGGDVIQYQSWLNILGYHSGYKLTKLEGMYSDVNLEEHAQHTVQILNGGDDDFFNMAYHKGLNSFAVTAAYKNGSTVPTNGIGYNICASQDAIVPQPDSQPC